MKNKSQSLILPFSIIAIVNIIFYLPVILKFPGFLYDDFTIFAMISHNSQFVVTDPSTIFFFFVRPISYLLFKLDYLIWGNYYVGMKLFTLVLHILFMSIFFLLLKTITELLKKEFNNWIALLVTIVFSIHPSSLMWVYWISNRTELLGLLFYSLSMLFFVKYFIDKKSYIHNFHNLFLFAIHIIKAAGASPAAVIFICFILFITSIS